MIIVIIDFDLIIVIIINCNLHYNTVNVVVYVYSNWTKSLLVFQHICYLFCFTHTHTLCVTHSTGKYTAWPSAYFDSESNQIGKSK